MKLLKFCFHESGKVLGIFEIGTEVFILWFFPLLMLTLWEKGFFTTVRHGILGSCFICVREGFSKIYF